MVSVLAELWHTKPHSQVVVELDTILIWVKPCRSSPATEKTWPNKLSEQGISPAALFVDRFGTLWCWSSGTHRCFFLLGEVVDGSHSGDCAAQRRSGLCAGVPCRAIFGGRSGSAPYCKVVRQESGRKFRCRWFWRLVLLEAGDEFSRRAAHRRQPSA